MIKDKIPVKKYVYIINFSNKIISVMYLFIFQYLYLIIQSIIILFIKIKKVRHLQDLNLRGLPHEISSLTP